MSFLKNGAAYPTMFVAAFWDIVFTVIPFYPIQYAVDLKRELALREKIQKMVDGELTAISKFDFYEIRWFLRIAERENQGY